MRIAPLPGAQAVPSGFPSGDLISFLSQSARLDHLVSDRTGLQGLFDFHLEWSQQTTRDASASDEFTNPSIFTALEEELGLKLDLTTGPVEVVVVDHVERPGEN